MSDEVPQPTPRLASIVLGTEAAVVGFAMVATRPFTDLPTPWLFGGGAVLIVALSVIAGRTRTRAGLVAGSVMQVVLLATAFVEPTMAVLGAVLIALWVSALVLGHRAATRTQG